MEAADASDAAHDAAHDDRRVCQVCLRPDVVCYCRFVTPLTTRTRVVILQHPRERTMPFNTARIASLCLPGAELHVGLHLPGGVLSDLLRPAALLYPGPGAIDVEASPPATPITLVVVDGTWSQAKKLVRLNPALAALPRYAFRPPAPSEYRIRREPREDYVSTLEALIHVLGALEGDRDRFLPMLRPFRAMVDAQLAFASGNLNPRLRVPRVRTPSDPRERLPPALRAGTRDLVCVHGEANAWPYESPERATCPEELVHWAAFRPATGETFEAIVAPRNALCPKTPWHLEIESADLRGGSTVAAMLERWSRFARPEDVVCSWGTHTLGLFESAGGTLPAARVDLRRAARAYSNCAVGTMDSFHERLAVAAPSPRAPRALPAPPVRGRAGVRLATLSAIASYFAD